MKWSTLAVSLFTARTFGAPVEPTPKHDLYTLRVSSKYEKSLDGAYLTLRGSQVGVYPRPSTPSTPSSLLTLYPVPVSNSPSAVELHLYPETPTQQVLAFTGERNAGVLDLSIVQPTAAPTGDWRSFGLVANPRNPGEPENLLTYSGGEGRWVAFPGQDGWSVNWRSADAITIEKRSYMLIDVVYEPVMVIQDRSQERN